ncbi:MAG: hypothetical protein IJ525_01475 [Alphaproteobacteria bacterium]|nr:hypothetical protein [Alphaproteobacteria bacterium]
MSWQSRDTTWKEMVHNPESYEVKPLSTKLKEMGFAENTFMVVKDYENIKVSDGQTDGHYNLVENPYASFGGQHVHPYEKEKGAFARNDFQVYDDEMAGQDIGGKTAVGMVGSNNGVYAAKVYHGKEMIITKDPEIIYALRDQLHFADGMGVPMSNGGIIIDYEKRREYDNMKFCCARKADREGQELRTAAVQRGDIITTYDPNDKGSDGVYKNVRHYEKTKDGHLKSIDRYQASHILQEQLQYGADTQASISRGQKLDGAATSKMLSDKWIDYGGR